MSSKRSNRNRTATQGSASRAVPPGRRPDAHDPNRNSPPAGGRPRGRLVLAFGGVAAALVALVAVWAIATGGAGGGAAGPTASFSSPASVGTVVQGQGGQWTNISADRLDTMLKAKDFTFLNVKTPYIGEIAGTDLYIPYTQLQARAAELPADRTARIVVYCRSGNESAIASQTLLDLGYTNILNLDGGMNAWTAAGHTIVQKART